jgi:hypothetical protein
MGGSMRIALTYIFASLLLSSEVCISAQDLDESQIKGTVYDQNGAAIPDASMTLRSVETGIERVSTTGREGSFLFGELLPGFYTLEVYATNFGRQVKELPALHSGQNLTVNFTLLPADLRLEQTVVGEVDSFLIDQTRTVTGDSLTGEEIESLPTSSREPLEHLLVMAGTIEEPLTTRGLAEDRDIRYQESPEESGLISVAGGPAYSNNITIDGLDNNDERSARERFQPSIEVVEEVQLVRNQFSPEYGRASGSRINLRTRRGRSRVHGTGFYFFRDESLNANTFNNNRKGLTRIPFQEHNPGATLSGPIGFIPFGKHFFFGGYEYNTVLDTALIDTYVPVKSHPLFALPSPTTLDRLRVERRGDTYVELAPYIDLISTPLRKHLISIRTDHFVNKRQNTTFTFHMGKFKNLRNFSGGNRLPEAYQGQRKNSKSIGLIHNLFIGEFVNQTRVQFSTLKPEIVSETEKDSPVVLINYDLRGSNESLIAGGSTSGAQIREENRFQLINVLSTQRGAHSIRVGGEIQRIDSRFTNLRDATGTYYFDSATEFLENLPSRFVQRFGTESQVKNRYYALFIGDEWRVKRNLLISYGLRYEAETVIRDRDNFGPRLAMAFSPLSNRFVIRAGFGTFYNRVLLRTVDDFRLGRDSILFDTDAIKNGHDLLRDKINFPYVLSSSASLVNQYGVTEKSFIRQIERDIKIPESYQFNIGFEYQPEIRSVVEINYTRNRGVHLWREYNANAPLLPAGYSSFAHYLLSKQFDNRRGSDGIRPLYNTREAGDIIRFTTSGPDYRTQTISRQRITSINLASPTTSRNGVPLRVALAAVNNLRPDPTRGQVETLASIGNSLYNALSIEYRRRMDKALDFSFLLRASYTLSKLMDDGIVNTSEALTPGNFHNEYTRSLLDRRHRFTLSGLLDLPRYLGSLRMAPRIRASSGAPFNISIGSDRNLDDVENDRPNYKGEISWLRSRKPSEATPPELYSAFELPLIGTKGDLPRNAGRGSSLFLFDLSISREFRLREQTRLRPVIEIINLLNSSQFSYGAEYINYRPNRDEPYDPDFLVATRTYQPRTLRLGLRFTF